MLTSEDHPHFWDSLVFAALDANLHTLQEQARVMAYEEVLRPSGLRRDILSQWHLARQEAAAINADLTGFIKHWPSMRHLSRKEDGAGFKRQDMTLDWYIDELADEIEPLEEFLFNLGPVLVGTITLQDSARSTQLAEQSNALAAQANKFAQSANDLAERGMWLTLIAAVYLPLTLVTGIFGMNIKEINDGNPRWWACVTAFVLIGSPSLAAAIWIFVRNRKAKGKRNREVENLKVRNEAVA
ncbi:uncharacterized protein CLAFUR5_08096 [Fulvia fulva]|uniref:CorA-like Mg2+ transporter protein n=1 Tax=Passalora fulva TaxID=5499 RepID=A0A9Q8LD85_PASFU|nr:uncharacterized protein CLAFUR5_08096 [Fulvia fulva]KAK4630464.1 hypothetical protein CLAFUR0_07976 [Fulvia fulva]UJO15267.1 hypothetical protein CLAFUR5_08096 [Fulvia fulva]